jgi:hypothetical protein
MLVPMRFLATMLLVLMPIFAQGGPPPQKKGGGGPPKNLKVLTPEQLQAGAMRQFTLALGVDCNYCHVQGGDKASDDNPKKLVARSMITMAKDINARFPQAEGKTYVTCYTCHRGKTTPETVAPAPPPRG